MKHGLCIVLFAVLLVACSDGSATQTEMPEKTPTTIPSANTDEPMSAVVITNPTETVSRVTRSAPATPTRFVATEDVSMIQPMLLTAVPTIHARLTERASSPEQTGSLDNVTFDIPNEWFVSEQSSKSVLIEPKAADGKTFIRLELVEDQFEISQLIGDRLLSHDQVVPIVDNIDHLSLQVRRLALVDSVLILMEGETLANDGSTYRQLFRDVYDSLSDQSDS